MSGAGALVFTFLLVGGLLGAHSAKVGRWRRAARSFGMRLEGGFLSPLVLLGRHDGFDVTIADRDQKIRVTIRGTTLPAELELKAENLLTRALAPDVLTGDAPFDEVARVLGRESLALAVLDAKAREAVVREIVAGKATFDRGGRLVWTCADLHEVSPRLHGLVDLAARLRAPGGKIAERLEENATSDPDRAVRLRNLRLLQSRFPETRACRRASRACLRESRAELRLAGAAWLAGARAEEIRGAPGPDPELADEALGVLAELATARNVPEGVNVAALRHLLHPDWRERAIPVLEEACGSGWASVQRAAIEGLGRIRHRPSIGRLADLIPRSDGPVAEAIAEALGGMDDAEAEGPLLRLLGRGDRAVRLAAIRSLGRVGTASAVEPLLRIEGRLGLGREARAAERARTRIQRRLEGAEAGQLSLAEPAPLEGAVSRAGEETAEGAVSLARHGEGLPRSDDARAIGPRGDSG